jgi:hypothetical protein
LHYVLTFTTTAGRYERMLMIIDIGGKFDY